MPLKGNSGIRLVGIGSRPGHRAGEDDVARVPPVPAGEDGLAGIGQRCIVGCRVTTRDETHLHFDSVSESDAASPQIDLCVFRLIQVDGDNLDRGIESAGRADRVSPLSGELLIRDVGDCVVQFGQQIRQCFC